MANFILSGNIPNWNDSLRIFANEKISKKRVSFRVIIGMLLGPRDFPDIRREITSYISHGVEGDMTNELPNLSPRKFKGDLLESGMLFVISFAILTKNYLNICNNSWI